MKTDNIKYNDYKVSDKLMQDRKQQYYNDLELIKKEVHKSISFKEMVRIVASNLGYSWDDIVSNMPKDLYEAFGYDARFSYLSGVKNLSDCKHPALNAAINTLNKLELKPYFMDVSVDIDRLERIRGNRDVDVSKVASIIKSINMVGNVNSSNIILNSKNEIIDGQHRACALIILGQPFTISTEMSGDIAMVQCMNACSNSWDMLNHIESRAELGIKAFMYIVDLLNRYKHLGGIKLILSCVTKRFHVEKKHILNESLIISLVTDQAYIDARCALDYLESTYGAYFNEHHNYYKSFGGVRNDHLLSLLTHMCFLQDIDMDVIMKVIYDGNMPQKNNTTKLCLQSENDIPSWAYLIFREYYKIVGGKNVTQTDCEIFALKMRDKLFELSNHKPKVK